MLERSSAMILKVSDGGSVVLSEEIGTARF